MEAFHTVHAQAQESHRPTTPPVPPDKNGNGRAPGLDFKELAKQAQKFRKMWYGGSSSLPDGLYPKQTRKKEEDAAEKPRPAWEPYAIYARPDGTFFQVITGGSKDAGWIMFEEFTPEKAHEYVEQLAYDSGLKTRTIVDHPNPREMVIFEATAQRSNQK